jgi:phosphoglycolate phosphatase
MSRTELIILDWDGTLIDSSARIVEAVQSAVQIAGLPERDPQAIRQVIGLGMDEAIATLYPDLATEDRQRLMAVYREAFAEAVANRPAPLFAGVAPTLSELEQRGYLLAIATGKSRSGLHRDLAATGVFDRFVAARTVDECPSKPDPAMVNELLRELALPPAAALMVGDTVFDLEMARSAGLASIAVTWGAHDASQLEQGRPQACIERIGELPGCVRRLDRAAQGEVPEQGPDPTVESE